MARAVRVIVLDTSVVSLVFNGDPRGSFYLRNMTGERTVIAFQTVEEVWYGAYKAGWGDRQKNELALHLAQYEVVWPDQKTADISANLRAEREKAGQKLNSADAWIAATALRLSCPLASHDGDFDGIPDLTFIRASSP